MQQPPSIRPAERTGPRYDPIDRIVQELVNIQSFISHLAENPADRDYLNTHLSKILEIKRRISTSIDQLSGDPYSYSPARLNALKKGNEKIFSHVEGIAGAVGKNSELKKFIKACEEAIENFDQELTP